MINELPTTDTETVCRAAPPWLTAYIKREILRVHAAEWDECAA